MNAHKKSFLRPHIYQGVYQKYIFDTFTKVKKINHMNNKYKNISIILNGTEIANAHYGMKYGYRYSYQYGYGNGYSYGQ